MAVAKGDFPAGGAPVSGRATDLGASLAGGVSASGPGLNSGQSAVGQRPVAPAARQLVRGVVLAVLHGLENLEIAKARWYEKGDWDKAPVVMECRRLARDIKSGRTVYVSPSSQLADLLARARQDAGIGLDWWEAESGVVLADPGSVTPEAIS